MINNRKTVFISVPMSGLDECLIKRRIQLTKRSYCRRNKISARDVLFYDNLTGVQVFMDYLQVKLKDNIQHPSLGYLGVAVQALGNCDEAVFAKGWKDANGCCIEHEVCVRYGIPIMDLEE